MSIRENVLDRLAKYSPDCGDNSCRFAVKKGGMRTNGGCRCMSNRSLLASPPLERLAAVQVQIIYELLNEIDNLNGNKDK